jgi:hypothetical protein
VFERVRRVGYVLADDADEVLAAATARYGFYASSPLMGQIPDVCRGVARPGHGDEVRNEMRRKAGD